jgi:hypothetical protein
MTDPNKLLSKLTELNNLYCEVKEIVILAENFDSDHDVLLTSLNELRNSLDHIMRSLNHDDKFDLEFDEAGEHLYRAGYDAYEVLSINVAQKIIKIIEVYDREIISTVFPSYYREIKPSLINIKTELAEVRAHKRLNPTTGTKSFAPYKQKVDTLIKHLKHCEGIVPDLQFQKRQKSNGALKNTVLSVLLGIIITFVGTLIYDSYKGDASAKLPNPSGSPATSTPLKDSASKR